MSVDSNNEEGGWNIKHWVMVLSVDAGFSCAHPYTHVSDYNVDLCGGVTCTVFFHLQIMVKTVLHTGAKAFTKAASSTLRLYMGATISSS